MKSLIVNLFGGPGAGKSSKASEIFSRLKALDINCELVGEFAKECVWENRLKVLSCQPYLFGVQLWRMERLANAGVPIIICDSPLLLSGLYGDLNKYSRHFLYTIIHTHNQFENINFVLKRVKKFNPEGRVQNEAEAKQIDNKVEDLLHNNMISYYKVWGDDAGLEVMLDLVLKRFEYLNSKEKMITYL